MCTFTLANEFRDIDQSAAVTQETIFEVIITFEGEDISAAQEESNAFLLDPEVNISARVQFLMLGNQSVDVEKLVTAFTLADMDVFSKTYPLDFTLSPGSNFTFIQTWNFKNYVGLKEVGLISGVYKVRYDLHYTSEGNPGVLKGEPFYVRFSGNPLTSAFGIVSTVAVAQAGVSLIGMVNSMRKSIQLEVDKSLESTKVSPTEKLMSYYRGKSYKTVQDEVSDAAFRYMATSWKREKCPQCGEAWPEGLETCPACNLSLEEARELYSKSLTEKSLNASKEIVDSVSGLSLKNIADSLGEGVIPSTSIISILSLSGLTLVQPRVGKNWGVRTRKLVFTGIRTTLFSLFWIQASGLGTISLTMLVIAILSGMLLPMLISRIFGNSIKGKIKEYWSSKQVFD